MFFEKIICIFGGTGSIGLALVKELLTHYPKEIRIVANNEHELWEAQQELKDYNNISYIFGDIRELDSVDDALEAVDLAFNCAALKHVPFCEDNVIDAVHTNILGLENILRACKLNMVQALIHISTDKAVKPRSVMGATKLIGERLCLSKDWLTVVSIVRFGNVFGSRGSLIPIIERNLMDGKVIPLTDERMKRYFITIENAAKFILNCMEMMEGGEIFVPQMEELFITDVIDEVIRESGIPPSEVTIQKIGKRPGEKLSEKLMTKEENLRKIKRGEVFIIK